VYVRSGLAGEGVVAKFPAAVVNRLLRSEGLPFDLATRHEVVDNPVTSLVYALADEAVSGSPVGALYVEGLTLALIGLLSAEHGARRVSTLSPVSLSRPTSPRSWGSMGWLLRLG